MTEQENTSSEKPKDLYERLLGFVSDTASNASRLHEEIIAKGGYCALAQKKKQDLEKAISEGVSSARQKVEEDFYNNGKFDCTKAKEYLSDKGKATVAYGEEVYKDLSALLDKGVDIAEKGDDYLREQIYKFIPTPEELETKYQGIGGLLILRSQYDACLEYHKTINNSIPDDEFLKPEILEDIKSFGANNFDRLHDSYADKAMIYLSDTKTSIRAKSILEKLDVVRRYMS